MFTGFVCVVTYGTVMLLCYTHVKASFRVVDWPLVLCLVNRDNRRDC